ncbi:hypothetical protein [Bradyrhizobium guangdongense]|uniref:hypothetical protein n=1 Tax=Bradyrhizobium guangdongense TaxID=1325090 RepID=UPI001319C027|nr:hypothetical protein [Bradyrhizobium guangdongense]
MAVRTRIDSISRDIDLVVNEMLSPAAQSRAVAAYARAAIAEADETNRRILGRLPPKVISVDGRRGAQLEQVKPSGGVIVAEWELFGEVLAWIGQTLRDRSPRVSGAYRDAHTLFADGVETEIDVEVPQADVYTFINLTPYARKLEVGKTESGRDFLVLVPNRIYERTYRDAKARFGNTAKITFGYETQTGAYRLKFNQVSRSWDRAQGRWRISKRQRADRVAGSAVSVPAIKVSFRGQ